LKKHLTTFYVETLIMIIVFISIILVLTRVLGGSRVKSSQAELLTNAVCLAQNAAEAFSVADTPAALKDLLDQCDNTEIDGDRVCAVFDKDMVPDPNGSIAVYIDWMPDDSGRFISGDISVINKLSGEELYSLETAVYLREVAS